MDRHTLPALTTERQPRPSDREIYRKAISPLREQRPREDAR